MYMCMYECIDVDAYNIMYVCTYLCMCYDPTGHLL